MGDLERQCPQPFDRIVFLLDGGVSPERATVAKMRELKEKGFRFGMFRIENPQGYRPVLQECEYLLLNQKTRESQIGIYSLHASLRFLKLVATHIDTAEDFKRLKDRGFSLFEGRFYRIPVTKGRADVTPLKVNLVRLLNTVQDPDFNFDVLAQIVERDTALTISLMRLVNSPYLGLPEKIRTIPHAIAMLGESEVRKWVATSVSRLLGADKHDEITRLSLIRAKFAENLAAVLGMRQHERSLFLMGVFSVLDVVLDLSMREAMQLVHVDDDNKSAILNDSGPFSPVYRFILAYEQSDWTTVSRELILNDVEVDDIFDAYINAALWYKSLIEEAESVTV
jgi:EAL and modified HD-GYP domain-containing signal transduction protein